MNAKLPLLAAVFAAFIICSSGAFALNTAELEEKNNPVADCTVPFIARESSYIQSNNPKLSFLTASLTQGLTTDREKVEALHNFVFKEIKYKIHREETPINNVLIRKTGDCSDRSILLVSMLQNTGIKSYFVLARRNLDFAEQDVKYVNHAYVIACMDHHWVSIETTMSGPFDFYSASMQFLEKNLYITDGKEAFKCG